MTSEDQEILIYRDPQLNISCHYLEMIHDKSYSVTNDKMMFNYMNKFNRGIFPPIYVMGYFKENISYFITLCGTLHIRNER